MTAVTLYHNARCSKSRAALASLRERGVEPTVIEYLKHPPDAQELKRIIAALGILPRELLRRTEDAYRSEGLDDPSLDDDAIIAAMVANPILIERPIAVAGDRAVIGRPPERVLELL